MDRFALLLADLGSLINVPLHPDGKRGCRLNIDNKLHLQLKDEPEKDRILVATFVGDVPPGKFRENILKETLKENGVYPRTTTLGYSEKNNKLALFSHVYYEGLHGNNMADFLEEFIEKCLAWKTALETGALPTKKK
jgi:hypothetical protein